MAAPIIARQLGDEYQQLVFWKYALMMLSGRYEIENIRYEDDSVKSYDDIVIQYSTPQIFRDSINIYEAEQEDGRILRSLKFRFPVFFNNQELYELDWDNESTVETIVALHRTDM